MPAVCTPRPATPREPRVRLCPRRLLLGRPSEPRPGFAPRRARRTAERACLHGQVAPASSARAVFRTVPRGSDAGTPTTSWDRGRTSASARPTARPRGPSCQGPISPWASRVARLGPPTRAFPEGPAAGLHRPAGSAPAAGLASGLLRRAGLQSMAAHPFQQDDVSRRRLLRGRVASPVADKNSRSATVRAQRRGAGEPRWSWPGASTKPPNGRSSAGRYLARSITLMLEPRDPDGLLTPYTLRMEES